MSAGLVAVVLVGVLGLWLWGRPREHVARPTASSTPQQVVTAYVRALDERDFATASAIAPNRTGELHWWTLHPVRFGDLRITRVTSPATAADGSGDRDWKNLAVVDTTVTMRNGDGAGQSTPGISWQFTLGRQDAGQPWQVVDQGQG